MSTELPRRVRARFSGSFASIAWIRGPVVSAILWLAGCGEDPPGRPGTLDGGRGDGSVLPTDGAVEAGSQRPDSGPELPDADREVVLPRGGATTTVRFELDASPADLDVQLAIDTTGSFREEIDEVQSTLAREVVPAVRALVERASFGVSFFQDFPTSPYGSEGDRPFVLLQRMTDDETAIRSAVARLDESIGNGGDVPESGFESMFQIATGLGYSGGGTVIPRFSGGAASGGGTRGGAGFRDGSFRVLVHATDALSHDAEDYEPTYPSTHSGQQALAALKAEGIYVVGITNGGQPHAELVPFALATGAFIAPTGGSCPTGVEGSAQSPVSGVCPLVFDIYPDGTGLSTAMQSALVGLVTSIDYARVVGSVSGDRHGLVQGVVAALASPPAGLPQPATEDTTPGDGLDDSFLAVRTGTRLAFDLVVRNDDFPSQTYEQSFRVRVRVTADSVVLVDSWVRLVVPALDP